MTYKIEQEHGGISLILPEPAQIIVPANGNSSHFIPIPIEGSVTVGEMYTFPIEFFAEQEDVKVSQSKKSIEVVTSEKPAPILFQLAKKGTIVFPTMIFPLSKTTSMNVTFSVQKIPSSNRIDLSFQPFQPFGLPRIIEPKDKISLTEKTQTVTFKFSRSDLRPSMHRRKLIFDCPPGYSVAEFGHEDAPLNKMLLKELSVKFAQEVNHGTNHRNFWN